MNRRTFIKRVAKVFGVVVAAPKVIGALPMTDNFWDLPVLPPLSGCEPLARHFIKITGQLNHAELLARQKGYIEQWEKNFYAGYDTLPEYEIETDFDEDDPCPKS